MPAFFVCAGLFLILGAAIAVALILVGHRFVTRLDIRVPFFSARIDFKADSSQLPLAVGSSHGARPKVFPFASRRVNDVGAEPTPGASDSSQI